MSKPLQGFKSNCRKRSASDMGAVEYDTAGPEAYFKFDVGTANTCETFIMKLTDSEKIVQARNILVEK